MKDENENKKLLSEDIQEVIKRLKQIQKESTFDISPSVLGKLPPHILKIVLELKRQAKTMDTRISAAHKIKKTTPDKKKLIRIDDILEIDPNKTLRASLTPEELKQLRYKKNQDE